MKKVAKKEMTIDELAKKYVTRKEFDAFVKRFDKLEAQILKIKK